MSVKVERHQNFFTTLYVELSQTVSTKHIKT